MRGREERGVWGGEGRGVCGEGKGELFERVGREMSGEGKGKLFERVGKEMCGEGKGKVRCLERGKEMCGKNCAGKK